jgi:hypothetical protein
VQLVIALMVTPDGFPLAYEVMNGASSAESVGNLAGFSEAID